MAMEKERFSLLLLEPNEIYFEDFSVDMLPDDCTANENIDSRHIIGRLKLCSKSLVFDPKNIKLPMLKIPFKDCESISTWPDDGTETTKSLFIVRCSQYIKMLENNVLAPYEFIINKRTFKFSFHYININDYFLQMCQQLHRASTLHASEQNNMIATIVFSRHNGVKFNPLWLDNIYEKILFDCKVDEINPLVLNPGKLNLTDSYIYLQPYNNIKPYPVIKIKLSTITSLIKRRFLLRHTGLEIKWNTDKHIYISYRNTQERDSFCELISQQPSFNIPKIEPESMTLKWQNRIISNYEYLLYLNSLADRTVEDLTQYPVFPWVITDYTSEKLDLNDESIYRDLTKPIGALNPERLERLRERCQEMGDSKFLYGSHYSAPGLVLFYLVRKFPHLMLCLQNGHFDHPDRMFNKVSDSFRNCLTNMSDFKELIPEFYDTSQGDFLLNLHKINFGVRSDGTPVNHVTLPPWANSSPEQFIRILNDALESDYVSKNLNHWIDLIFGYKQRGDEALKADNLFYYLCYEGGIDLDTVKDLGSRHALEIQISEFGQIPKQLFNKPHVARNPKTPCSPETPNKNMLDPFLLKFNVEFKLSYTAHKEPITSISFEGDTIISTGKDGVLKFYNIVQQKQVRNLALGSVPLSACYKIKNSNVLVIGSWDNTILLYNCDYGKVSDIIPAHDDAVSCLNLIEDLGILISASWDCTVKVWKGFNKLEYKSFRLSDSMIAYFPFEEKITCLDSKNIANKIQLVAGTGLGEVFTWELNVSNIPKVNNVPATEPKILVNHKSEITGLAINGSGTKLASCSEGGSLFVTDITTGMILFSKILNNSPTSLCWCNDMEILLIGDESGVLSIWDLIDGNLKCSTDVSSGPVTCVKYNANKRFIITGGSESSEYKIKCWCFN